MSIPTINTRATNVELNDERKSLISRKLMPLARYLRAESKLNIDVVMRKVRSRFGGDLYCVSVKVITPTDTYMAVATESHLSKALTRSRETLRRSISKGASVVDYELRRSRQRDFVGDYTLAL